MRRFPDARGERAIAFVVAALLPLYLALDGGGYDLVSRQGTALALWAAIALGLAFGILPRARPPAVALGTFGALAALVALSALALTSSLSDERAAEEIARLLGYGAFAAAGWLGLRPGTWPAAVAGLSVALATVSGLALLSRLAPAAFPANPLLEVLGSDRLFYPLGYWNAVAAWAAIALAAMLAWSTQARRPAVARLALATMPICMVTVYLTYSRGGTLAAIAGSAAVVWLARERRRAAANAAVAGLAGLAVILIARGRPEIAAGSGSAGGGLVVLALLVAGAACAWFAAAHRRRARRPAATSRPWAAAVLTAAAFGTVFAIGAAGGAWEQFGGSEPAAATAGADPAERLASFSGDRSAYWSAALDAGVARPLSGIGPGAFEYWWEATGETGDSVRDAHSLYLEPVAELGLPGVLAILALAASMVVAAIRPHPRRRRSAAALAALGTVITFLIAAAGDWLWEFSALTCVAMLAAAASGAAGSRRVSRRSAGRRPRPGRRWALAAVAVACAAAQVPGLVSEQLLRASASSLAAGDLDDAGSLADDAITAAPWSAAAYAQRGRVRARRGDYAGAIADAGRAISRVPLEPRYSLLLDEIRREIETSVRP